MKERNSRYGFSENFKRKIVVEIESGKRSGRDVRIAYGIKGHSTILKWCRRYGGNQYSIMNRQNKASVPGLKNEEVLLLQNQVKALEQELKESRLKQVILETLIDVAERHLSIDIKKNFGGKQSAR